MNNWEKAIFVLLLPLMLAFAKFRTEPNLRGVIWSDAEGYYIYLPAIFNIGDIHKVPEGSMNARKNDKGEVMTKYTCGVAYFELPFFLAARAYCDQKGYARDDIYNRHYSRSVVIAATFAAFLGLLFLYLSLKRLGYSLLTRCLTLAIVFGGTNLFHYASKEVGMSHVYSFGLFAILVWHLPRFYERPKIWNVVLLGVLCGWIALIRPTNLIGLLIVPFWNVYDRATFKQRLAFFAQHKTAVLGVFLAAMVMLLPQLWYWHEMTGQWIRNSYGGEGEHEDFRYWNKPKILDVLFDVQNGLFLYSPLVLLMVVGMFTNWSRPKAQAKQLLVIFALSTYVFASWWAWWFGGAFGHRSYVELYALFALPLAALLAQVEGFKNRWLQWGIGLLIGLGIFYSVRMSLLYNILPGPWDGADWRWNSEKIKWVWAHLI